MFNNLTMGNEAGIGERIERTVDDAVERVGMYSRVGTLFGLDDTAKLSRANYLDRELRPMIDGMKAMGRMSAAQVNGNMLPGGVAPAGNIQISPDNPELFNAVNAGAMLANDPRFKQAVDSVRIAQTQISVIRSTDRIQPENRMMLPWLHAKAGQPWTNADKLRAENDLTRIIQQERTIQLYMMKQTEENYGFRYSDYAGKSPPMNIDSPFYGEHEPLASDENPQSYIPTPEALPSQ